MGNLLVLSAIMALGNLKPNINMSSLVCVVAAAVAAVTIVITLSGKVSKGQKS